MFSLAWVAVLTISDAMEITVLVKMEKFLFHTQLFHRLNLFRLLGVGCDGVDENSITAGRGQVQSGQNQ